MEDITSQIMANTGISNKPKEEELEPEEVVEQEETAPEQEAKSEVQENASQKNWRLLSEQAEEGKRAKKERDEAYRLLGALEQRIKSQETQQVKEVAPEDSFNLNDLPDDEYSDNKKIKHIIRSQEKKYEELLKKIEQEKVESTREKINARIARELPDYKEVVSEDNLEAFRQAKPYLFKSLAYNPDLYEAAVGAYDAIKDLGIYKSNKYAQEEYQIKNNLSKPRASATVSAQKKESALDKVGRYNNPSAEDLKHFYEDAIKKSGRSMSYNE